MTDREFVLNTLRRSGRNLALQLQANAPKMTGTELNAETDYIPSFTGALKVMNMLKRKAGFVCRASSGRVVRLLQPYDSDTFTQEPEELPAQWGFAWSTDPEKALPFVQIATSPYGKGDCCTWEDRVYRSLINSNVHSPKDYPQGWEEVVL